MKTKKHILSFFDAAIFYDYKNLGIVEELDQVRKCVIKTFHETIPVSRILIALPIIDVVFSKFFDNDIEYIGESIDDLKENIIYLISIERLVEQEENSE